RCDISALLASMDISVVPSRSESLSNVILESMAAGVPVLATDVGGNRELLANERGLLVPSDNPNALAAGLGQMLRNANLRIQFATGMVILTSTPDYCRSIRLSRAGLLG